MAIMQAAKGALRCLARRRKRIPEPRARSIGRCNGQTFGARGGALAQIPVFKHDDNNRVPERGQGYGGAANG